VDLAVDTSVPEQTYYEDCAVCCRPMQVTVRARPGAVLEIEVSGDG
jgi:cysteine-rich CPXCG protein